VNRRASITGTLNVMNTRHVLLLPALLLCGILCACGNKGELLQPSEVPPEDAGRYLIRPKSEPQPAPAAPAQQQPTDDDNEP